MCLHVYPKRDDSDTGIIIHHSTYQSQERVEKKGQNVGAKRQSYRAKGCARNLRSMTPLPSLCRTDICDLLPISLFLHSRTSHMCCVLIQRYKCILRTNRTKLLIMPIFI